MVLSQIISGKVLITPPKITTMEYDNPYFDDELEYYHDAYGDTEKLEEKVGKPLTIAEIKEFMSKRTHVTYDKQDMELLVDEKTGLLYTEQLDSSLAELLINHCLGEPVSSIGISFRA